MHISKEYFFSIVLAFFAFAMPIYASDAPCPLETPVAPPLLLRIMRAGEKVLIPLLMDPSLQTAALLSQAKRHNHYAATFRLTSPPLGYQELLRSIDALTRMEKPIRAIGKTHIPFDAIQNTIGDMGLTMQNYTTVYGTACNPELTSAANFLLRNKKTLEKLYYESLLITTKDLPDGRQAR